MVLVSPEEAPEAEVVVEVASRAMADTEPVEDEAEPPCPPSLSSW